ncbi:hypothetical protein EJ06DRAFT_299284 [Trichodelitschia bisporula]|uniref:Uncharacterized protein n=1 Tax=Trichodelitschia bisporula TaxID=703511 RepID=A0A6G1I7F2_9PEZI|nr:hypothetical protein EJ06DRAFT_299284 [Trichodelitschia bisporula]
MKRAGNFTMIGCELGSQSEPSAFARPPSGCGQPHPGIPTSGTEALPRPQHRPLTLRFPKCSSFLPLPASTTATTAEKPAAPPRRSYGRSRRKRHRARGVGWARECATASLVPCVASLPDYNARPQNATA